MPTRKSDQIEIDYAELQLEVRELRGIIAAFKVIALAAATEEMPDEIDWDGIAELAERGAQLVLHVDEVAQRLYDKSHGQRSERAAGGAR